MPTRTLRLYDMKPHDVLTVQFSCGHISRFAAGELQRESRRGFSDMLIWDLQYRLRCQNCRRAKGMRIILRDGEPSGTQDPRDSAGATGGLAGVCSASDAGAHIVIVEGEVNERVRI